MADFRCRLPKNVPGKFYTDIRCLDCYACRETVPSVFYRDDGNDTSYVFKQPSTPEELALCEESVRRCPCQAIGDDGDQHDWSISPLDPSAPELFKELREGDHQQTKRKWKFW